MEPGAVSAGGARAKKRASVPLRRRGRRGRRLLVVNAVAALLTLGWYLVQSPTRQAEVRLLVGNTFASGKEVSPLDVALDLWQMYSSKDYVEVSAAAGDRTHAYAGWPQAREAKTSPPRLLVNRGYAVGYAEAAGNPLWAAYRMADLTPLPEPPPRPERFEVDRRTAARIAPEVYSESGYERGHLAPNYGIALRHGAAGQAETFLMSNIIPQRRGLNGGLWSRLERRAATNYPARFGEIWVLAGPVFGGEAQRLGGRGREAPLVPEACFMILADESEGRVRALAFVFPQEPRAGAELEAFLTTVDEVERRTGLDFFAELDDAAEAELEAKKASRVW